MLKSKMFSFLRRARDMRSPLSDAALTSSYRQTKEAMRVANYLKQQNQITDATFWRIFDLVEAYESEMLDSARKNDAILEEKMQNYLAAIDALNNNASKS